MYIILKYQVIPCFLWIVLYTKLLVCESRLKLVAVSWDPLRDFKNCTCKKIFVFLNWQVKYAALTKNKTEFQLELVTLAATECLILHQGTKSAVVDHSMTVLASSAVVEKS